MECHIRARQNVASAIEARLHRVKAISRRRAQVNRGYFGVLVFCAVFAPGVKASVFAGTPAAEEVASQHCQSLAGEDFAEIQDAPAQVTNAKLTAADGDVPA